MLDRVLEKQLAKLVNIYNRLKTKWPDFQGIKGPSSL